jgi:hypothetical protein
MSETAAPATAKPKATRKFSLADTTLESGVVKSERVNLDEYIEFLRDIPQGHNHQKGTTIPDTAITVAKSRFSQAANRLGIGVRFTVVKHDSRIAAERGYALAPGQVRLLVSTGAKRKAPARKAEGEAKKPAPAAKGLAAAVKR